MKKLNPFKPFIVLGLTIMYAVILLISCGLVVALTAIPEMPPIKYSALIGISVVWFGLVIAIIECHQIIRKNRKAVEDYLNGL